MPLRAALRLLAGLAASCLVAAGAAASTLSVEAQSRLLERAHRAVVGLEIRAVDGARTEATLGSEREGSGVVIGADGLVLTIGYLVLEAEEVMIVDDAGRRLPARVVGVDVTSGLGLVQSLVPLRVDPAPMQRGGAVDGDEPLMFVSGGSEGDVAVTRVVAQRAFSGMWEYHLDRAFFTHPPRRDHSGAGLFNARGELVGIGSLVVNDALGGDGPRLPGNMFVPVEPLAPLLAELRATGRAPWVERAWIGINCVEREGALRITRVSDDSPADVAGLQAGDRIVAIDGVDVTRLEQLWKRLWAGSPAEREVRLEIEREGERQTVSVFAVDRAKALRRAEGV
ncbi:MAG: S1C family serine protease [Rubrivivax sp.]|jgi:S1-C subfamily serine protease|nr:S1C family serine protease [Rubrivivax sp.]